HLAVDHVLGEPHVAVAAQGDGPGVDPVRGHREGGDRAVRGPRAYIRVQLADGVRRLRQLGEPQPAVRPEEDAGRVDATLRAVDARTAGHVEGTGHAAVDGEALDLAHVEVVGVRHPQRVAGTGGNAQGVAPEGGDGELADGAGGSGPHTGRAGGQG